jgi:hypothetical protein
MPSHPTTNPTTPGTGRPVIAASAFQALELQDEIEEIIEKVRLRAQSFMEEMRLKLNPEPLADVVTQVSQRPERAQSAGSGLPGQSGRPVVLPFLANRHERRKARALGLPTLEKAVILNKWEGQVTKMKDDGFVASVYDMNKKDIVEIVEFDFNEVAEGDLNMAKEGALFYWYILNYDTASAYRDTTSRVWFRRKGRMTDDEYRRRLHEADEIWRGLGWDQK